MTRTIRLSVQFAAAALAALQVGGILPASPILWMALGAFALLGSILPPRRGDERERLAFGVVATAFLTLCGVSAATLAVAVWQLPFPQAFLAALATGMAAATLVELRAHRRPSA
ncbi:MAG: hypothetical protein LCH84_06545 [Gemmatimonadetes bacterium]|nr:hypothetical protein [Gemmatimonadota bacterium]